jgi:hypothetical protein
MYAIYNRELTGYSLVGDYRMINDWYERNKKYVLSKDSILYGNVMVSLKRVKCGATIKFRFFTSFCTWKPELRWKYDKAFHWLWFHFHFDFEYADVYDKTVKDHLIDGRT